MRPLHIPSIGKLIYVPVVTACNLIIRDNFTLKMNKIFKQRLVETLVCNKLKTQNMPTTSIGNASDI